jgi:hypothetical protein
MNVLARRYLIGVLVWVAVLLVVGLVAWLALSSESSTHWSVIELRSEITAGFWAVLRAWLGLAALILVPPAIIVGLRYWRRGGGERAA